MFIPSSQDHQCSTIPIEETKTTTHGNHSYDRAGYEVYELTHKLAQCPVCKRKYTYGSPMKSNESFVPYSEVAQ